MIVRNIGDQAFVHIERLHDGASLLLGLLRVSFHGKHALNAGDDVFVGGLLVGSQGDALASLPAADTHA